MVLKGLFIAALGVLLLGVGLSASAQTFGGTWETYFGVLQTPSFHSSTITLYYNVASWTFKSESLLTASAFEEQVFLVNGSLGAFLIDGGLAFSSINLLGLLTVPLDYSYSWMDVSIDVSGVTFLFSADHFRYPWGFLQGATLEWPCPTQTDSYLLYTVALSAAPFSASASFDACCGPICFKDVTIGVSDLGFCGMEANGELEMSRRGFEYVKFRLEDVVFPDVSWLSFDMSLKFETQTKTVTLEPALNIFGGACFEFYGGITPLGAGMGVDAIEFYGLRLYWEFTPCSYIDCLYAVTSDAEVFAGLFDEYEFEYMGIGFCGPSCCSGEFSGNVGAFFWHHPSFTTIFGLSRIVGSLSFPISNLTFDVLFNFELTGRIVLDVGWTLTF
jgi:hypothetical protein